MMKNRFMIYSTVRNQEASFEYICITSPKKHINMGHANKKRTHHISPFAYQTTLTYKK